MKPLKPLRIFNQAPTQQPENEQHWYRISAATKAEAVADAEPNPIEIYIYGEIGGWGITANQFLRDLKAIDDGVNR